MRAEKGRRDVRGDRDGRERARKGHSLQAVQAYASSAEWKLVGVTNRQHRLPSVHAGVKDCGTGNYFPTMPSASLRCWSTDRQDNLIGRRAVSKRTDQLYRHTRNYGRTLIAEEKDERFDLEVDRHA